MCICVYYIMIIIVYTCCVLYKMFLTKTCTIWYDRTKMYNYEMCVKSPIENQNMK